MRRFVEDYPSVDIGLLKRRGLFDTRSARSIRVETSASVFEFAHDPLGFVLATRTDPPSARGQRIEIQTAAIRYGERRYFICPKTRQRCAKLYFVDGSLASRDGHGLVHLTTTNRPADIARAKSVHLSTRLSGAALGKGPARGTRKKALVEALAAGDAKWIDPAAAQVVHRAGLRRGSRRLDEEAARWTEGSSTKFAVEAGRAVDSGWTEQDVLDALSEPLELAVEGKLQTSAAADHPPDWLAPRARLDVRSLSHAGLFEVEELRGAALLWDRHSTGVISCVLMAADFRDPYNPFLLLQSRDTFERVDYLQIVRIEYCEGRWYFRCPILGTRKTTLYLREGMFGSREALNLRTREWDLSEDPEVDPDDDDLRADEPDEDYPV